MKPALVLSCAGLGAIVIGFAVHALAPAIRRHHALPPNLGPPRSVRENPRSFPTAEPRPSLPATLGRWFAVGTLDGAAHERLMAELRQRLTADDTADLVASLSFEELHTPFGAAVVEHWLNLAPAEAARWLAACVDPDGQYARLVAQRLGQNPAALHTYCDQLPGNDWREQVLRHASLEKADQDPRAAVAFAQKLAPGGARVDALETIAYAWFGQDPAAALEWSQTIPEADLRERLMAVGAKALARVEPDLAADWLATGVRTSRLRQETALCLAGTKRAPAAQ